MRQTYRTEVCVCVCVCVCVVYAVEVPHQHPELAQRVRMVFRVRGQGSPHVSLSLSTPSLPFSNTKRVMIRRCRRCERSIWTGC
jgi:hypothetical protein